MSRLWDGWRRFSVDGAILLCVAALALALWGLSRWGTAAGTAAVVTTPDGQQTLSLSQNGTSVWTGRGGLSVTLQVENGRIRFAESHCPDHLCEKSGWLQHGSDTAACVPAGVSVRVVGASPVDGVAK